MSLDGRGLTGQRQRPAGDRGTSGDRVVSVALALLGGLALTIGLVMMIPQRDRAREATTVPSAPSPTTVPARRHASAEPARDPAPATSLADPLVGPLLAPSDPVRLRIPALVVSSSLVALGLDASGAMAVPADPAEAGWYTQAPPPGALGPAVIAGHVTWNGEPGVFYRLGDLRRGDRVEVLRADGRVAVFGVRRILTVAKARFPTQAVYGPTDHAALRLITCAGRYDAARGHYADNVVVFARLVGVRGP